MAPLQVTIGVTNIHGFHCYNTQSTPQNRKGNSNSICGPKVTSTQAVQQSTRLPSWGEHFWEAAARKRRGKSQTSRCCSDTLLFGAKPYPQERCALRATGTAWSPHCALLPTGGGRSLGRRQRLQRLQGLS